MVHVVDVMKLGYELTIEQTQKLSMTPELIQTIKILQLNTVDLAEYVHNELMENPVLEVEPRERDPETAEAREAREEAARAEFEKFITSIVSNMVPIRLLNCRIGKYEVTQTLWEAVMGENPSEFKGADNPVENVSWDDCQEFLQKLNALPAVRESGLTFRLPTDEEWEVACRAGSTGNYCLLADGTEITADTLRRVAWYTDNSVERTHRVGQKQTNAFGLYDMHGNVWEWTQTADGEARVLRGGCWCSSAGSCESSYRGRGSPSDRNSLLGFRLCASGKAD